MLKTFWTNFSLKVEVSLDDFTVMIIYELWLISKKKKKKNIIEP